MDRRSFLLKSMGVACSAAASPLITPVTYASAPSDNRLVVIILRGAMDGLDVVRPIGDNNLKTMRPEVDFSGQHALDDFYALHPTLDQMMPLWNAGDLAFAHAVSTPYRDKRSHFDGQDLLEAGFGNLDAYYSAPKISGWLNRMLTQMQGVHAETAFAVGTEDLILLKGDAPSSSWAPGRTLTISDQGQRFLQQIYADDPLFHASAETAIMLSEEVAELQDMEDVSMAQQMQANLSAARRSARAKALAEFTSEQLLQSTRIAAFSIGGWDTHANQANTINGSLNELSEAILTLKNTLGAAWETTTVLGVTEFGRTVRMNGSGGSDHGTGGAMLMAGGAIKGGQVMGDWPGLRSRDLYQDRDLMPTADVREYIAVAIRDLFGLKQSQLEQVVFPSLSMSGIRSFIA